MKFLEDFALCSKGNDGFLAAATGVEYAIAAAGPVLASCSPGPSEYNRPVL